MSSLWKVKVIDKGKEWIDLMVIFDHPDAGSFPEDPNFALQLLTSEAYGFDKNYNYTPTSPLGNEISHEQSYLPDDLETITSQFIKSTNIYQAKNLPWSEENAHALIDKQVRRLGLKKSDEKWEESWTDKWRAYWQDESRLPFAKYRIVVTQAEWIAHMEVDKVYHTASFSKSGPWISENRDLEIETFSEGSL